MKKGYSIILGISICITFSNCSKNQKDLKEVYNQKANELISQIIQDNNCNCLLEIPTASLVEISLAENPSYDIRGFLAKELNASSKASLDSLVSISKDFRFNTETLQKNHVEIITIENLRALRTGKDTTLLKRCPKGILGFRKPVFDKTFQKAVLDHGDVFASVVELPFPTYEFKKDKWEHVKRSN